MSLKTKHKKLLTASEAAEYLGLGEPTLRRLAKTGRIPVIEIGGHDRKHFRFPVVKLDEWLRTAGQAN